MLLFVTLLAAAAASPQPIRQPVINPKACQPTICPATSRYEASRRGKTRRRRSSTSYHAADVYLAVYRQTAGARRRSSSNTASPAL